MVPKLFSCAIKTSPLYVVVDFSANFSPATGTPFCVASSLQFGILWSSNCKDEINESSQVKLGHMFAHYCQHRCLCFPTNLFDLHGQHLRASDCLSQDPKPQWKWDVDPVLNEARVWRASSIAPWVLLE